MASQRDIKAIQLRLERARLRLLKGQLTEPIAWSLHNRVGQLLERDPDSPYQQTLTVIYTLTEALWSNTRQQQALREFKAVATEPPHG